MLGKPCLMPTWQLKSVETFDSCQYAIALLLLGYWWKVCWLRQWPRLMRLFVLWALCTALPHGTSCTLCVNRRVYDNLTTAASVYGALGLGLPLSSTVLPSWRSQLTRSWLLYERAVREFEAWFYAAPCCLFSSLACMLFPLKLCLLVEEQSWCCSAMPCGLIFHGADIALRSMLITHNSSCVLAEVGRWRCALAVYCTASFHNICCATC
jgi:hypothetical protein